MCIAMIIQYHILLDNSYCSFPEHLKPVDESLETLRYQFRVFKKQQISQISDFLLDVNIIVSGGIQNVIGVFQKLQKWTDLEISPFPGFFRLAETIRGSKIQVNQQTKPGFSGGNQARNQMCSPRLSVGLPSFGVPRSSRPTRKTPEMKRARGVHKSRYQKNYPTPKTRKVTGI